MTPSGLCDFAVCDVFFLRACVCVPLVRARNGLRSKLNRNFGKLYIRQGRFEDALASLAQDAYYSSVDVGPENIATAGAYFHMGGAFLSLVSPVSVEGRVPTQVSHVPFPFFLFPFPFPCPPQGNQECALAMYDKVVDAWYKHLVGVKSTASPEVSDMQEAMATEVRAECAALLV